MRTHKPKKIEEVIELLERLNCCHDASLRRICFSKPRKVNRKDGSLIYPFGNLKDEALCDVELELILNSYPGAKIDQIVLLEFQNVSSFNFMQAATYDYSDILEVKAQANDHSLGFIFYSTKKKIATLKLSCQTIVCKEV